MQPASRSLLGTGLFCADAILIPSCLPLHCLMNCLMNVVARREVQIFPGAHRADSPRCPPRAQREVENTLTAGSCFEHRIREEICFVQMIGNREGEEIHISQAQEG